MFEDVSFEFTKLTYAYSARIIYLLYFIIFICAILNRIGYFGNISKDIEIKIKTITLDIQYWLKIYVATFLIIVYNPFIKLTKSTVDEIERKIIFNSGVIILLSILLIDPTQLILN